jgi:soluble lytic murein transglycosylase
MAKLYLPLILITLVTSCLSTSLNQKEVNLASHYKKAKQLLLNKQREKACSIFQRIEKESSFPLKDLLEVQLLKSCTYPIDQLVNRFNRRKNISPYLQEEYLGVAYDLAKKNKMGEHIVLIGLSYNHYPKIKNERDKIALELIKYSKGLSSRSLKEASLDNLLKIAPRLVKKPAEKHQLAVAKDYAHVRHFKNARKYYQLVINNKNLPLEDRIEAYYKKSLSFKLQRNKVLYSNELTKMMAWLDQQNIGFSNEELNALAWSYRLKSIRALWTISKRNKAEILISKYLSYLTLPKSIRAEINVLKGLINLEKKEFKSAYRNLESAITIEEIKDETLERATWSLFWAYYSAGQYQDAQKSLTIAIAKTKDDSFKNKLLYWRARNYQKLNKKEKSIKDLISLTNQHSFNYYTILAHKELGITLKSLKFSHYPPLQSSDSTLTWLNLLEENVIIREYLKDKKKKGSFISYTDYHYANWYDGGIYQFFALDKDQREQTYKKHLPMAFPTPYRIAIQPIAVKRGLPEAFIYAIARQESAFNKYARSWADAFGLLQVTPEKAKQLHNKYSIPYKKAEDLYDESINIEMGSLLLKKLATSTRHNFIDLVASYNAGSGPLRRWRKERFNKDPIEFIESIPYKETRNYIKLVFRNYITYKRLLGEDVIVSKDFFKKPFF